jgi:hypothetical protein
MSERCYRFKPDALMPHAPRKSGVYEFVTFDAEMKPEVLYVGLAIPGEGNTIYEAVAAHMMGNARPTTEDLFKTAKDVYFDYVDHAEGADDEDFKDIAGALIKRHSPRLNPSTPPPSSGKYGTVTVEEVD